MSRHKHCHISVRFNEALVHHIQTNSVKLFLLIVYKQRVSDVRTTYSNTFTRRRKRVKKGRWGNFLNFKIIRWPATYAENFINTDKYNTCKSWPIRSLTHNFTSARLALTLMRPSLPRRLINWSGFTTSFYSIHTNTVAANHCDHACIGYCARICQCTRKTKKQIEIQKLNAVINTGST